MRHEVFNEEKMKHTNAITNTPPKLYPQERDWTCAIACVRTLLSSVVEEVPSEEELVLSLTKAPGPIFSNDIKELGFFQNHEALYGCDNQSVTFDEVLNMLDAGYVVMLESMINYSHWLVLIGFFPLCKEGDAANYLLVYDPYYNELRTIHADEFIGMWCDGEYIYNGIEKDYVAVKQTKKQIVNDNKL